MDLVILTFRQGELAVLLVPAEGGGNRTRRELPWRPLESGESLERAAAGLARETLGAPAAWMEQVRAYDGRLRHPGDVSVSLAFVALTPTPESRAAAAAGEWVPLDQLPPLPPRQRAMVDDAVAALRTRVDLAPIAFLLLPRTFTLSQLQEVYELLLGRSLHKASFRRALQAARLVQPLAEWRSEGRGRPAQLYRYAPAKRRTSGRSARFEF
ncbi:MAG TPA: hypothetical protein VFS05_00055 [Gemmatimonadaceae bacterium]|nr:hypothetical protein [Gemmatimonadaceae bacterium]